MARLCPDKFYTPVMTQVTGQPYGILSLFRPPGRDGVHQGSELVHVPLPSIHRPGTINSYYLVIATLVVLVHWVLFMLDDPPLSPGDVRPLSPAKSQPPDTGFSHPLGFK